MHRTRIHVVLLVCATLIGCGERPDALVGPLDEAEDLNRLLSDEELRTPTDPSAPAENPLWSAWVEQNHEPIRSLTSADYSDLGFLRPLIGAKRVVQLGESGHGVREFSQAKVRLIKFLHEELGFDVLALESSIFECFLADRLVGSAEPVLVLDACAFPVWRTSEVLELFEYMEETRSTARPLRLAGFDTQISSRVASLQRPRFLADLVDLVDEEYGARVKDLDSEFIANYQRALAGQSAYVRGNRDRLVMAYDSLAAFFDEHRSAYANQAPSIRTAARIGAQTARSMVAFVDQLSSEGLTALEVRDDGMASNFRFVLDELFPDDRVIVWSHNYHVRYANHRVHPAPQPRTMGAETSANLGDDVYTIGLYMYTGTAATNDGSSYQVAPATPGSLASILYRARKRWVFVDLRRPGSDPGADWMTTPITAKTWGVNPLIMVPRDQYDGILFVHTVTTPRYLPTQLTQPG